jgi:CRISPR-associated exonuclease Cas4
MTMYTEDQYILLSALQHYIFCPRQCGLIHVCGLWEENRFTARGKVFHERVDSGESESRGEIVTERGLLIYSKRLGLSGKTDAVEFIHNELEKKRVHPVEYKSGSPKIDDCDKVQLCAQGLCLEEMMNVKIESGALYYGETRHRLSVIFDDELRTETERVISAVHAMVESRIIPDAKYAKKCNACSLLDECMPWLGNAKSLKQKTEKYIEELYHPL